jgi:hypothetical protein
VSRDRLVPVRPDLHEVGQHVDQVGALALPLVPARVLRGLQDVAPLRIQPAARVLVGAQDRADGRPVGHRRGCPAPERVQDLVRLVSGVQVVIQQPADGLPLLGLGIIARRAHGRVPADEVVEMELAVRGPGQQMVIEQGGEGFFRLGQRAVGQGRGRMQADVGTRADAQPPEQPLVVGLQGAVGQVEGSNHLRGRRTGATQLRGRLG